jgi:hypothetical protein
MANSLCTNILFRVLFHDENEISMGLRRLALSPYYRKYFDFFQVRDPPKDRMKQLGIPKLNKLILFMANPILLSDPESDAPIDKISYELPFIIDHLKMFLDDMINDHGKYLQKIPEIKTQKDLDSIISSSSKRYYLLFIIDKSLEVRNDQLIDREHDMLIINKHGGENVTSAYIDFSCHPYLANKFRFEDKQVPLLVIYDAINKSFYRSEFRLNIYDGRNLVSKVIQEGQFKDRFRPAVLEIGYSKCNEEEQAIEDVDL